MRLHEILKDYVIPLIAPMVAIIVPTILFYVIPRRWARQNLALELFDSFFGEEMRLARLAAWSHFVTDPKSGEGPTREERFELFRQFLTEPEVGRRIDEPTHSLFQRTSRVLDYFAIVDGCLARGSVDPRMVRSFLAYYWFWWRLMVLRPLRAKPAPPGSRVKHLPMWMQELRHLDQACRVEAGG